MKKIIFATIFAGLCAVGANAAVTIPTLVNGCYEIDTIDKLYGFAAIVNGTDGQTANKTACGKLTQNINDNGPIHETNSNANAQIYANALTQNLSLALKDYNNWTPIEGFAGTFDGNGKTISGLYYWAEENAGFFKSVYGGAVIRNVKIADSYFRVDKQVAGGLVAKVAMSGDAKYDNKLVIIDNCVWGAPATYNSGYVRGTVAGGVVTKRTSVSGNVSSSTGGSNIGGLIGVVASGMKVTLSNSVNAGRVLSSYTDKDGMTTYAREEVIEGVNIGGLIAYVENGAVANVANCYNTGKVDSKGGSYDAIVPASDGTLVKDNVACLKDVQGCNGEAKSQADLSSSFAVFAQSNLFSYYDAATVESIIGSGSHPGVTFSDDGLTLIATFTDVATTFSIPQDIKVDKVVFNRKFTNNKSSTIALPFNVTDLGTVSGATFYSLAGISPRDQSDEQSRDTINAEAVTSVEAYKPYLVQPGAENGTLSVSGAVTLKKSEGAALTHTFAGDDWTFTAVLEKKKWAEGGDNANELGKVYGFAGAESGSYHAGNFVLIGKAYIMPMRAYLIYNKDLPECGKALCKPSAVELPEEFVVRYSAPKAESVVEEVSSIEGSDETPSVEGFDEPTTGVVRTISIPATVKDPRWFDFKGRSVSHKPKTHGAFVKNNTPIVVK